MIGPATKVVAEKEDYTHNLYPPDYYFELVHSFFPNLRLDDIFLAFIFMFPTLFVILLFDF